MKLTRTQAVRRLTSARGRIKSLRESSANSPKFLHWNEETLRLILDIFPNDSAYERGYRELSFGLLFDPHHKPGTHQADKTYLESLDKAEGILDALLTLLAEPGAAPAGSSLASDPSDAKGASDDVVVLHGPDDALLQKVTPTIAAAERNRIAVTGWPEDPEVLTRQLQKHAGPFLALALLGESDLEAPAQGTTNPPEVPREVAQALDVLVAAYGEEKVRVVVQTKNSMKAEQVPAQLLRVDPRGQWRAALAKLLKSTPS